MRHRSNVTREDSALAILFLIWGFAVVAFSIGARVYMLFPPRFHALRCVFKETTGLPCATCGSTRTFALMGEGRFAAAMRINPFIFFGSLLGLLLAGHALGAYLGLWRFSQFGIIQRNRRLFTVALLVLFLANWLYLILTGA